MLKARILDLNDNITRQAFAIDYHCATQKKKNFKTKEFDFGKFEGAEQEYNFFSNTSGFFSILHFNFKILA